MRRIGVGVSVAASLLALACGRQEAPERVAVRNPDYFAARPIQREADAEHTIQVELPYSGAGVGYASDAPLLDLNSIVLEAVEFSGGRTSLAGEATLWLPLKPEAVKSSKRGRRSTRASTWASS